MNILYVGDVMGEVGIAVVEQVLPKLQREKKIDLVIAQAENVSEGKGITLADYKRLQKIGVDFFTGGNHSLSKEESFELFNNPQTPIIRPANYKSGTPGLGYKYAKTPKGAVLVVTLLGKVVGRDADKEVDNPLHIIDSILEAEKSVQKVATIVNFHGDFSSEKIVIGHYLDGRVTAVVGDHWHVPTADARVLPGGTAHMTDVGMCGALNSSLGVTYDAIISRWRDNKPTKNELETSGPRQFNALLIESDDKTCLAESAQAINLVI